MSAEAPWLDDPITDEPESEDISGSAAFFADAGDLARYHAAKRSGASEEQALSVGDNGIGSDYLGRIDTPNVYGVALPEEELRRRLGDDQASWRTARAIVPVGGQYVGVPIVDIGPGRTARSRGVVTDMTAPLAAAAGNRGSVPISFRIKPNAGPDYLADQNAWYDEQRQIAKALPTNGPWSDDPVASTSSPPRRAQPATPTQPAQGVTDAEISQQLAAGERALPSDQQHPEWLGPAARAEFNESNDQQPWLKDPAIGAPSVPKPTPEYAGIAEDRKPPASFWASIHDTVQNFWASAKESAAQLNVGAYRAEANAPAAGQPNDPFEQEIQEAQVNPDLSDDQKNQMISALRDQQARARAQTQGNIVGEEYNIAKAQAEKPGQAFQDTFLGRASTLAGQAAPYLAAGAAGPLAPFAVAGQMTAGAYANAFDRATADIKRLHPDWSDTQALQAANDTATESARSSGQAGLALSFVPLPAAGPLIARMVTKLGLSGATLALANVYSRVQENIALQKNVDPGQDILDGLGQAATEGAAQGVAFGVPHALGEIGRGTPRIPSATTPQPEAERPATAQPEPPKAAIVEENAEAPEPEKPVENQPQEPIVQHEPEAPPEPVERPVAPEAPNRGEEAPPERGQPPEPVQPPEPQPRQPGPAFDDLSEDQQAEHIDNARTLLRKALDPYRDLFTDLGVATPKLNNADKRPGYDDAAVRYWDDGTISLELNPELWVRRRFGAGEGEPDWRDPQYIDAVMREELIHAAHDSALRQEWEERGAQGNFGDYVNRYFGSMLEQVRDIASRARSDGNNALARLLNTALDRSQKLYGEGVGPNSMYGAELVRQLVQLRQAKPITENFFRYSLDSLYSKVKNFFQKALGSLQRLSGHIDKGTLSGSMLEEAVRMTEGRLAQASVTAEAIRQFEEQGRASMEEERGQAREGEPTLLEAVKRAGGLPTPARMRQMGGENLAGELARVHDAWKALGPDGKQWLKKQGIRYSDLFRADAKPLDRFTSDLGQQPGARFDTPGEMLAEVESALAKAQQKETTYGGHYTRGLKEETERAEDRGLIHASPITNALRSLFIPNREDIAGYPHTEELLRAVDQFRGEEGELQGRVAVLNRLYKELTRKNPKLGEEVNAIGKTVEAGNGIPAHISPEAQRWLQEANNGLFREIGDRMRVGGFKVRLPDGGTRSFIGAPAGVTPFPRIMRPDVSDALSKPLVDARGNLTPEAQKIYDEGTRTIDKNTGKPYFSKPEDLLEYARQYKLNQRNTPAMTGLERARVLKFPSFFYTYSPEAMLGTLGRQATEIARLNAFGQKLGQKQPDLFDRTVEAINADHAIGDSQAEAAVSAINALRNNVYGLNRRGTLTRLLRGASSAGLAGSPHTSSKIGLSMLFNVPAYRGVARTLGGILDTAFRFGSNMQELRRLGLSNDIITNLHDDPRAVTSAEQQASNLFTGVLRVAGHALAQDIGKSVTASASRSWLTKFAIPKLQADPELTRGLTRMIAQDIQRRGINPADFSGHSIDPKLIDRFVREDVNDLQTAYRPEDYPAWQATTAGSIMFQFGHWAYNGARTIVRDSIIPGVQALRAGDPLLAGRYFARLSGIAIASIGASELWRQVDKLFGGESNVATVGEIWQAFSRSSPVAAHLLVTRLVQDLLGAPTIGMFGDLANWAKGLASGTADTTHYFNPVMPAGVGYGKILVTALNQAMQQGGKLSDRQKANFASQLAGLVKGYYDLANTVGAPLPGHAEAVGRREDRFVKSRLDLFYEEHPEWDKRAKSQFAGNVHTPYLQDLNEALLSGNAVDARRISRQMATDLKLDAKHLHTSLEQSVKSHLPIPSGNIGQAFRNWAQTTMTPDERTRMQSIDRVYRSTAVRIGVTP